MITNKPCRFRRLGNGWWECTNCGFIYHKPSSRPPTRRCGNPVAAKQVAIEQVTTRQQTRPPRELQPKPSRVVPPLARPPRELGDLVSDALATVGITKERVSTWLGRPCGCGQRQERLNQLSRWAKHVLAGQTEDAKKYLERIING